MRTSRQLFFDVLHANKQRQGVAQHLNQTSGQELFRVYTDEELRAHVTAVLADAKCIADLSEEQIEQLRLPALDQELVKEARIKYASADNSLAQYEPAPTLMLLGQEITVDGHRSGSPRATLNVDWHADLSQLTNEATTLPNGARVLLKLESEWGTLGESRDMPTLRHTVRSEFFEYALEKFRDQSENRQVVDMPDLESNLDAEIPAIVERTLCLDPSSGQAVLVHGAVHVTHHRKLGRRLSKGAKIPAGLLGFTWFTTQEKAINAREALVGTLRNWRNQQRKSESYLGQAEELIAQLVVLRDELAAANQPLVQSFQEQLDAFARLNKNKGGQIVKWNENAQRYIDRGNRAIVADVILLKSVLEKLGDQLLSQSAEGSLQDHAIESISVLEKRIAAGTLSGNIPLLIAIRTAVRAACEPDDETFESEEGAEEDDHD